MGRAPWLEEFASRWATRWVESQLPSWLGAALRQTSIGFELRSMRFMLHRASVDDTSMTCCSCTPARPCLCEALTPRIAARCTTVTISLAQMDPVVHSASFATCVISLCDYQSCVHSTMFLVPNACNQLKGRTKGKGKGGGKILFTSKSHFQLAYILTGLTREFGVAKGELDIQLLNTTVMTVVPRSGAK